MPSLSLQKWRTRRRTALDELRVAHSSVGGTSRGRRHTTLHINQAYAVLLLAQFQGYCRDLHSECADLFIQGMAVGILRTALRNMLLDNRKLDKGNANPANIGADFGRFGLVFWQVVRNLDLRNEARQSRLEELNRWRNAIAHQDFDPTALGANVLQLQRVGKWRNACYHLASGFDEVMRCHLLAVNGVSPW